MADAIPDLLEALQALHRNLVFTRQLPKELRVDLPQLIATPLEVLADKFKELLDKPARNQASRNALLSGKLQMSDDEYEVSSEFQEVATQVADELELDEIAAARIVLDSQKDIPVLGRTHRVCALIRFHQQRRFLLDCIRLLLELSRPDEVPDEIEDWLGSILNEFILGTEPSTQTRKIVPRCMAAMRDVRAWIQKLADCVAGAQILGNAEQEEFREVIEFSQISLVQQHELLAVIICHAIDRRVATKQDFTEFLANLRKVDRYDYATVHCFPILGTFITVFGSTEGNGDLQMARQLNTVVCQQSDDEPRSMACLHAAVRAWWLAEYSGWYMDTSNLSLEPGVDIDAEDRERSKLFMEALRDGAFDMVLAIVADVKASDWQDPARASIRQWLQRKAPSLPPDTVPFSDYFQLCLANQMEIFVDASISNLPDVLRKLRTEEDEQRQMKHGQEQDLDLERFLLIIAYAYDGRPEAADAFWADPDSNLAGFLQWASRRASTPLVTAFCEMLQSLSEDTESATSAHEFLLDDGHHATGKMRRNLSLTWSQILKELEFYIHKIREKPTTTQTQIQAYKAGKIIDEQAEAEPEFAMMLECYLRLIAKLASQSEPARVFLRDCEPKLYELLFELISSLVPPRLRSCAFNVLAALLCRKDLEQSRMTWEYLDSCMSGYFLAPSVQKSTTGPNATPPSYYMEALFEDISPQFEDTCSFVQFLTALACLPEGYAPLNDTLPFSETLGASIRIRPGIEPYVDFALGYVFARKTADGSDRIQQRILRYTCLEFALTCLATFNEDLIVFASQTSIPVDAAISTSDLATYVGLHPFARVMEWFYDSQFMQTLMQTVHQESAEVGVAAPDSPLILSVLRTIEVILKVLELQTTYLSLVRPIVKPHARQPSRSLAIPTSNAAYASIEDGLMTNLKLISDLGRYCGLGNADLTHASLKLLEKLSTSARIISAWQAGPDRQVRRNKAIVALEENGDVDAVSGSFISEFGAELDHYRKDESASYRSRMFILDFLYSTIRANPDRPTVAHLLLGFGCGPETLNIIPGSSFEKSTSLFHVLLGVAIHTDMQGEDGVMQQWLINLKYKAMRVFQALWSSRLSSSLVLEQLRENDFLFHLLIQPLMVQPTTTWDGLEPTGPDFLIGPSAQGYVNYLSMRAMALEYVTHELCSVTQSHQPMLKRRIFDALGGQIPLDNGETMPVQSIFDLNDLLPQENQFAASPPSLTVYRDIDIRVCLEEDEESNKIYNLAKVEEILLLKRNQNRLSGHLVPQQDSVPIEAEEGDVLNWAGYVNRFSQVRSYNQKVLKVWNKLLTVMAESNDFKGTNKIAFILQVLQAILPSLEQYGSERPEAAYELAKLAKVLLFNLDFAVMASTDKQSRAIGSLVSDKLFQLFQICLNAIAKWAGSPELRAVYYSICFRYISNLVDHGQQVLSGSRNAAKAIQSFGERLMNVVCDDAYSGDAACQTAALILLGALVNLGRHERDRYVVEMLKRLNFIGILVDSLRNVMREWIEVHQTGNSDLEHYEDAKLALLLQLCQTRDGARDVLHANLFRAIEQSGLFAADPELQVTSSDSRSLENHYALLVKVARIIGAAVVSRGSHNVVQGRRFLTEHRLLVVHVLKRSAGIGTGGGKMDVHLDDKIQELAEAFLVIVMATGFLEYENETHQPEAPAEPVLFH